MYSYVYKSIASKLKRWEWQTNWIRHFYWKELRRRCQKCNYHLILLNTPIIWVLSNLYYLKILKWILDTCKPTCKVSSKSKHLQCKVFQNPQLKKCWKDLLHKLAMPRIFFHSNVVFLVQRYIFNLDRH